MQNEAVSMELRRGVTAKEIAEGTGLSLSSVYRCLASLQKKGLIIKIPLERHTREPNVSSRLG